MQATLINTQAAMIELVDHLIDEPVLAVDTEFFRETSYFPHLGLIQIASADYVACIDPLAFDCKEGIKKLFLNEDCIKVFHSCSQDMEVLSHYFGFIPFPVHDTQIAHSLLSTADQIGYAKLVANELDVHLSKSQTRTNWLKRPLTKEQIQYAGDDVVYLFDLYHQKMQQLDNADRLDWFEQDCSAIKQQFQIDKSQLWKRVKGHQKASRAMLARIQIIALWREELAITLDKNRRRILDDEVIIQLAQLCEETEGEDILNQSISNLLLRTCRANDLDTPALTEKLKQVEHSNPDTWPENRFQVPTAEDKQELKDLQKIINHIAEGLGIAPGVLSARKALEDIIQGNRSLKVLSTWRLELVGNQILQHLDKPEV